MQVRQLSRLEQEGVIQRFEYTWELAWKVLKAYLESQGVVLSTVTPAAVIRAGLEAKVIGAGDVWMGALDVRNRMSRTAFERTTEDIRAVCFGVLDSLHVTLTDRRSRTGIR